MMFTLAEKMTQSRIVTLSMLIQKNAANPSLANEEILSTELTPDERKFLESKVNMPPVRHRKVTIVNTKRKVTKPKRKENKVHAEATGTMAEMLRGLYAK